MNQAISIEQDKNQLLSSVAHRKKQPMSKGSRNNALLGIAGVALFFAGAGHCETIPGGTAILLGAGAATIALRRFLLVALDKK
ncbi:MAG: hypothetical protein ACOYK8_05320 [Alphaproteobacteria bacterium]